MKNHSVQKGEFQYLKQVKRRKWLLMIVLLAAALTVFIAGYYISGQDKANIWTIFAVLMMLPAAKQIVSVIVTFPYHSPEKAEYDRLKQTAGDSCTVLSDMLISSREKMMYMDFMVLGGKEIVCYTDNKKNQEKDIFNYLVTCMKERRLNYRVKVMTDFDKFLSYVKGIDTEDRNEPGEEKEALDFIESLIYR
ncbi:hypothetical protein [Anaerolentibacter hominis]|uniref:hypothetical protein n=1 Tax=Anaerolentibacter hominis TaxID=3079009 RepID=UPI0031B85DAD